MHWEWRGMAMKFVLGQAINLVFYVSAIKNYTYGSRPSQAQYKLRHHVKMQFNKIPTTSNAMQQ